MLEDQNNQSALSHQKYNNNSIDHNVRSVRFIYIKNDLEENYLEQKKIVFIDEILTIQCLKTNLNYKLFSLAENSSNKVQHFSLSRDLPKEADDYFHFDSDFDPDKAKAAFFISLFFGESESISKTRILLISGYTKPLLSIFKEQINNFKAQQEDSTLVLFFVPEDSSDHDFFKNKKKVAILNDFFDTLDAVQNYSSNNSEKKRIIIVSTECTTIARKVDEHFSKDKNCNTHVHKMVNLKSVFFSTLLPDFQEKVLWQFMEYIRPSEKRLPSDLMQQIYQHLLHRINNSKETHDKAIQDYFTYLKNKKDINISEQDSEIKPFKEHAMLALHEILALRANMEWLDKFFNVFMFGYFVITNHCLKTSIDRDQCDMPGIDFFNIDPQIIPQNLIVSPSQFFEYLEKQSSLDGPLLVFFEIIGQKSYGIESDRREYEKLMEGCVIPSSFLFFSLSELNQLELRERRNDNEKHNRIVIFHEGDKIYTSARKKVNVEDNLNVFPEQRILYVKLDQQKNKITFLNSKNASYTTKLFDDTVLSPSDQVYTCFPTISTPIVIVQGDVNPAFIFKLVPDKLVLRYSLKQLYEYTLKNLDLNQLNFNSDKVKHSFKKFLIETRAKNLFEKRIIQIALDDFMIQLTSIEQSQIPCLREWVFFLQAFKAASSILIASADQALIREVLMHFSIGFPCYEIQPLASFDARLKLTFIAYWTNRLELCEENKKRLGPYVDKVFEVLQKLEDPVFFKRENLFSLAGGLLKFVRDYLEDVDQVEKNVVFHEKQFNLNQLSKDCALNEIQYFLKKRIAFLKNDTQGATQIDEKALLLSYQEILTRHKIGIYDGDFFCAEDIKELNLVWGGSFLIDRTTCGLSKKRTLKILQRLGLIQEATDDEIKGEKLVSVDTEYLDDSINGRLIADYVLKALSGSLDKKNQSTIRDTIREILFFYLISSKFMGVIPTRIFSQYLALETTSPVFKCVAENNLTALRAYSSDELFRYDDIFGINGLHVLFLPKNQYTLETPKARLEMLQYFLSLNPSEEDIQRNMLLQRREPYQTKKLKNKTSIIRIGILNLFEIALFNDDNVDLVKCLSDYFLKHKIVVESLTTYVAISLEMYARKFENLALALSLIFKAIPSKGAIEDPVAPLMDLSKSGLKIYQLENILKGSNGHFLKELLQTTMTIAQIKNFYVCALQAIQQDLEVKKLKHFKGILSAIATTAIKMHDQSFQGEQFDAIDFINHVLEKCNVTWDFGHDVIDDVHHEIIKGIPNHLLLYHHFTQTFAEKKNHFYFVAEWLLLCASKKSSVQLFKKLYRFFLNSQKEYFVKINGMFFKDKSLFPAFFVAVQKTTDLTLVNYLLEQKGSLYSKEEYGAALWAIFFDSNRSNLRTTLEMLIQYLDKNRFDDLEFILNHFRYANKTYLEFALAFEKHHPMIEILKRMSGGLSAETIYAGLKSIATKGKIFDFELINWLLMYYPNYLKEISDKIPVALKRLKEKQEISINDFRKFFVEDWILGKDFIKGYPFTQKKRFAMIHYLKVWNEKKAILDKYQKRIDEISEKNRKDSINNSQSSDIFKKGKEEKIISFRTILAILKQLITIEDKYLEKVLKDLEDNEDFEKSDYKAAKEEHEEVSQYYSIGLTLLHGFEAYAKAPSNDSDTEFWTKTANTACNYVKSVLERLYQRYNEEKFQSIFIELNNDYAKILSAIRAIKNNVFLPLGIELSLDNIETPLFKQVVERYAILMVLIVQADCNIELNTNQYFFSKEAKEFIRLLINAMINIPKANARALAQFLKDTLKKTFQLLMEVGPYDLTVRNDKPGEFIEFVLALPALKTVLRQSSEEDCLREIINHPSAVCNVGEGKQTNNVPMYIEVIRDSARKLNNGKDQSAMAHIFSTIINRGFSLEGCDSETAKPFFELLLSQGYFELAFKLLLEHYHEYGDSWIKSLFENDYLCNRFAHDLKARQDYLIFRMTSFIHKLFYFFDIINTDLNERQKEILQKIFRTIDTQVDFNQFEPGKEDFFSSLIYNILRLEIFPSIENKADVQKKAVQIERFIEALIESINTNNPEQSAIIRIKEAINKIEDSQSNITVERVPLLHLAATRGYLEITVLLIQYGAVCEWQSIMKSMDDLYLNDNKSREEHERDRNIWFQEVMILLEATKGTKYYPKEYEFSITIEQYIAFWVYLKENSDLKEKTCELLSRFCFLVGEYSHEDSKEFQKLFFNPTKKSENKKLLLDKLLEDIKNFDVIMSLSAHWKKNISDLSLNFCFNSEFKYGMLVDKYQALETYFKTHDKVMPSFFFMRIQGLNFALSLQYQSLFYDLESVDDQTNDFLLMQLCKNEKCLELLNEALDFLFQFWKIKSQKKFVSLDKILYFKFLLFFQKTSDKKIEENNLLKTFKEQFYVKYWGEEKTLKFNQFIDLLMPYDAPLAESFITTLITMKTVIQPDSPQDRMPLSLDVYAVFLERWQGLPKKWEYFESFFCVKNFNVDQSKVIIDLIRRLRKDGIFSKIIQQLNTISFSTSAYDLIIDIFKFSQKIEENDRVNDKNENLNLKLISDEIIHHLFDKIFIHFEIDKMSTNSEIIKLLVSLITTSMKDQIGDAKRIREDVNNFLVQHKSINVDLKILLIDQVMLLHTKNTKQATNNTLESNQNQTFFRYKSYKVANENNSTQEPYNLFSQKTA